MPDIIRREDCPPGRALAYPGKKTRNNPDGTVLSKMEYVDKIIPEWIKHFEDKERYKRTPWSTKSAYLVIYMTPIGIGYQATKKKLMEIERKLADETEEEELTRSLSTQSKEMDIDEKEVTESNEQSRVKTDFEIDKFLELLSDAEMFESKKDIPEYIKNTKKYKKREERYYLALEDARLLDIFDTIPPRIKNLEEFKPRQRHFVDQYIEEHFGQSSSQEILMQLPQTPSVVRYSEAVSNRLCHLSFEERSEKLVMQNIRDTVTELNKTPEGKKQAVEIIAGVSHEVYGDSGLGLTRWMKDKVKKIKGKLLSGEESTLVADRVQERQIFPPSVKFIGREHWLDNTIPEPAKHSGKAIVEEGETVPLRYQDRTDREMYESFKEDCKQKIEVEMAKHAVNMKKKLSDRKDSEDKQRRQDYADSLPQQFPSLDWYVKQRPTETKPLTDHTTGLCHLCEAAKMNYTNVVKAFKTKCSCGTKHCPNWSCACPIANDDEEETRCLCSCECEVCMSCQVIVNILYLKIFTIHVYFLVFTVNH